MKSTLWTIDWKDILKGLILAVLVPGLYYLQSIIPGLNLPSELKVLLATFIGYLAKNFATDDTKAAVKTLEKQNVEIKELQPKQ